MAANDYHFVTHWRVESTRETVYDLLSDAPALTRWWPIVYLDAQELEQEGENVLITYDWRIRAEKPLLRSLSFLLKPIFSANHRRAMNQGEVCLRRELARPTSCGPSDWRPRAE
jgi:hypothetical protein